MRFILRCAFWLSVVYVSMAWHHGAFDGFHFDRADVAAPVDAARHAALSLAATTKDQAVEFCRTHTSECLAEAAKLGALFSSASASQPIASAPSTVADRAAVPLPVPDPRRHARDPRVAAAR